MNERKIKIIVATAVTVFLALVFTLVVQISIKVNQSAQIKRLEKAQTELKQQLEGKTKEQQYMLTQQYLDEYALLELETAMGKKGTQIFK